MTLTSFTWFIATVTNNVFQILIYVYINIYQYLYIYIYIYIYTYINILIYIYIYIYLVFFFSLLIITLCRNGAIQWNSITYYMTSFGVLSAVRFTGLNLFLWRHWEITSDLLLSKILSGLSIIDNFSFKQRLHFFKVGL